MMARELQPPATKTRCSVRTSAALMYGTLPGVLGESLTRSLEGFPRFLTVIGEWAGAHLDLAKIATTAQVSRMSAGRWFEVLEDTLLVHRVDAFAKSATRRLVQHPNMYFFDVGVLNGLLGLERFADYYGKAHRPMVWYLGKEPKRLGAVDVLPWQQGLRALGW